MILFSVSVRGLVILKLIAAKKLASAKAFSLLLPIIIVGC